MLVTCATWNYWELLQPLLLSHQGSNPDKTLHVHAIDWPEEERQAAATTFKHAQFHRCEMPEVGERFEMLGPVPRSAAILKLKVRLLKEHYDRTTEPVIWVDADTLLLEPVDPLLSRLQATGDFAVTYRAKKRRHAKFAVAVLCFVRTDAAKRLLEAYVEGTDNSSGLVKKSSTDGAAWFHDQLALWDAYKSLSRNWLGLPRAGAPKLMALSDAEHSIDGSTDALFVSRRDGVLDLEDMQSVLLERGFLNEKSAEF